MEGQRGWRVPGPELERAVAIAARSILDDKAAILEALQVAGMGDIDINQVFNLVAEWRERLLAERERSTALVELVEKAVMTDEGIRLGLNIPVPCGGPGGAALHKVLHLFRFVPLKVKRRGVEMRLIINGGDEPRKPDPALLKAFARARGWFEELASGRVRSLVEIARREGLAKRYVTRLTKLAFVSPAFVEAIAEGEVPIETNLQMLMDGRVALPLSWNDQEQLFTRLVIEQNPIHNQQVVGSNPTGGSQKDPAIATLFLQALECGVQRRSSTRASGFPRSENSFEFIDSCTQLAPYRRTQRLCQTPLRSSQ